MAESSDTSDTSKSEKVEYAKPTSQVDLERRLADDATPVFMEFTDPDPTSDDGFVGVSPEYQNAANKTDEPLAAKSGAEKKVEQAFVDAYGDGSGPSEDIKALYGDTQAGAKSATSGESTTLSK